MEKTKQEYIVFLHQAMNDRTSPAFSEFYQFLVSCFARADVCMEGKVSRDMFDPLVEETVAMPRMYGFAPSNEALYPSSSLRKSARAKMFTEMDRDSNGFITLEEWISFALKHIKGKLAHLPKDYLGGNSDDVTKEEFVDFIKRAVDKA